MSPEEFSKRESIVMAARTLPIASQQAIQFSADRAVAYIGEHTAASTGLNDRDACVIAASRLQWALIPARLKLDGLVSEHELATMLDCFQGALAFPDEFEETADTLCEHWGVVPEEAQYTEIGGLVAKLRALSAIQLFALRDALEQAWHRGVKQGVSPRDVLATLGIGLTQDSLF